MYLCIFSLLDTCRLELVLNICFVRGEKAQLAHNYFKQLFFIAKLYDTAISFSLQVIMISRAVLLGPLRPALLFVCHFEIMPVPQAWVIIAHQKELKLNLWLVPAIFIKIIIIIINLFNWDKYNQKNGSMLQ